MYFLMIKIKINIYTYISYFNYITKADMETFHSIHILFKFLQYDNTFKVSIAELNAIF